MKTRLGTRNVSGSGRQKIERRTRMRERMGAEAYAYFVRYLAGNRRRGA